MSGIIRVLLLWAVISTAFVRAQDEDFTVPPPPADRILDESRLFARIPERRRAVAEALAELEEKHGFRLYYVLYDSLYGRDLLDRAQRLRESWLGERPGMVLLVETDSRVFKIGQAAPAQAEIEPGSTLPITGPLDLSTVDLSALSRELGGSLQPTADGGEFAEQLGIGMARGVSSILGERAAAPEGGTKTRMILLAIGLIAATGLLALLVLAGLKRAEARALERFVFPKIAVGIRLGAPYGGGKVSSRSFGGKPKG